MVRVKKIETLTELVAKFWAKKKPCEQRTPTGYLKSQLNEIMKS